MSSDGVDDVGASSGTLGNESAVSVPTQDSFRIYEEMMDTIESELESDAVVMNSSYSSPHYLAELWFPECRDCTCCKGFKHACECVVVLVGGGSGDAVFSCSKCQVMPGCDGTKSSTLGSERGGEETSVPSCGKGKVACKFFRSPQGCRFGDQCRFAHE